MFSKIFARRAFSSKTMLESLTRPGTSYKIPNQLFINGQWQAAVSGETFDTVNPGTGELITKVSSAGPEDIDLAVAAAKGAADAWGTMSPTIRATLMHKFSDKIQENADELATLECEDNGKPYGDAM